MGLVLNGAMDNDFISQEGGDITVERILLTYLRTLLTNRKLLLLIDYGL